MDNVHAFPPRRAAATTPHLRMNDDEVRRRIEEAAQSAIDTADHLIALLDQMDGDVDREDGADAEPSLGAPEGHDSQVIWLRGSSSDREQGTAR